MDAVEFDQESNTSSKFNIKELTNSCIYIIKFITSEMAKTKLDLLIIIQEFLQNSAYLIIDHFKEIIDNLFPYFMIGDKEVCKSTNDMLNFIMKLESPNLVWNHLVNKLADSNENALDFLLNALTNTVKDYYLDSSVKSRILIELKKLESRNSSIKDETIMNKIKSIKIYLINDNTKDFDETKWANLLNRIILDQKSKDNTKQLETILLNETIKNLEQKNNHFIKENLNLKKELENLKKDLKTLSLVKTEGKSVCDVDLNANNQKIHLSDKNEQDVEPINKASLLKWKKNKIGTLKDINDQKKYTEYIKLIKSKIQEVTGHEYDYSRTTKSSHNHKFKVYYRCRLNLNCNSKSLAIIDLKNNKADIYLYGSEHDHVDKSVLNGDNNQKREGKRLRTRQDRQIIYQNF